MKIAKTETKLAKLPSRRQFIKKAGLVTGVAILGSLTFLNACGLMESSTKSQSSATAIPKIISRIENLPEVTSALRTEKEQISSFSIELRQFQLDMNELDAILAQSSRAQDTLSDLSEERNLKLQILMEKRAQMESTLSNILKAFESTQRDLIANLK